jgi:glycosyltransferase involved in cell wall biosynthesis
MKVLYLSTWFPYPPDNGSRVRAYYLLRALAERHEVYLISLLQDDSKRENAAHLESFCKVWSLHESRWFKPGTLKSFLGFFSRRPRFCVDTFDPAIKVAVADAVERIAPDVMVASTLGVVEYVPDNPNVPSVLDEHNCEYAVVMRAAEERTGALTRFRYDLGWRKFARWEAEMCRRFDAVAIVSEQDMESLLCAGPDLRNLQIIPNGVDVERFDPSRWSPERGMLIYNGALTYGPNLGAARYYAAEIYPILRERLPDVRLRITGRTTGVDLRGVEDCPGIEMTGYVADMRDVLYKSAACIVPLIHGGGSRLKIVEAMAAGVPVVSTSKGVEGIGHAAGEHLLIANGPREFAEAVERVLTDPGLAGSLAASARKLVEERYSWKTIGDSFADLVERAVAERKTS